MSAPEVNRMDKKTAELALLRGTAASAASLAVELLVGTLRSWQWKGSIYQWLS